MAEATKTATNFAEGNAQFALDLYRVISDSCNGVDNIFFSPASISIAVAMTLLGARNNTAIEMKKTLGFSSLSDQDLHESFAELFSKLSDTGNSYILHIANRLFTEKSYKFIEEFMTQTLTHYKAESTSLDFVNETETSRMFVNEWVEKQTNNKIKDLLAPDSIDSLTRMILVNAIYFKGDWAMKFETLNTKPGTFTRSDGKKLQVSMMYQKQNFMLGYNIGLKCEVLGMPYAGDKMMMKIILPDKGVNINDVTRKLTTEDLLKTRMSEVEVHVTIPKFKIECSFNLNDKLKCLGMKEMFIEGTADFSGMDGSKELFVGSVVHKAFIEVNEEGSEAAAATSVGMQRKCVRKQIEFKADRPFLYYIQDKTSNTALFMGCMNNPEQ